MHYDPGKDEEITNFGRQGNGRKKVSTHEWNYYGSVDFLLAEKERYPPSDTLT